MNRNKKEAQTQELSYDDENEEEDEDALQAALKDIVSIPDVDSQELLTEGIPHPRKLRLEADIIWSAELKKATPNVTQSRLQNKIKSPRESAEISIVKGESKEELPEPAKIWSAELDESLNNWYAELNESQQPKRSDSPSMKRPQQSAEAKVRETGVGSSDDSGKTTDPDQASMEPNQSGMEPATGSSMEPEPTWSMKLKNEAEKRLKEKRTRNKKEQHTEDHRSSSKSVTFVEPCCLMQLETESKYASEDKLKSQKSVEKGLPTERSSSQIFKLTPQASTEDLHSQKVQQTERRLLNYLNFAEPHELVVPGLSSSIGLEQLSAELEDKLERIEAASNPKSYKKPKPAASTQTTDSMEAKASTVPTMEAKELEENPLKTKPLAVPPTESQLLADKPLAVPPTESQPLAVPPTASGMVLINLLAVPFQSTLPKGAVISASKVVDTSVKSAAASLEEETPVPAATPSAASAPDAAPAAVPSAPSVEEEPSSPATPQKPEPPPAPTVEPNDVKFKEKPASDTEQNEEREKKESRVASKSSLARAESMRTLIITGHTHIKTQWRDHCHLEVQHEGIDKPARRKLLIACALCLVFMLIEVVGGILSKSLAIATDAAHLLTDLAGFLISLFALYISARPKTQRMNFGWYRAEVIGAMISVYFIWVITGILVWLAIQRLWLGEHVVDAKIMLITSAVAILFNVIMAVQLHHGHGHSPHYEPGEMSRQTRVLEHAECQLLDTAQPATENINVRAAMIHVIGDMIQSVGVFVAALIIFFQPTWAFMDAVCTFLFSIIVLLVTFRILRDVLMVLMEATPDYMDYDEVQRQFLSIEGVEHVHNLRIWALSINKVALSAHLAIKTDADAQRILEEATTMIHKRYRFFETTIQIEEYTPGMEQCEQCIKPGHSVVVPRGGSLAMEEGAGSAANKQDEQKPVEDAAKS
ncbi:actin cytoskeleton-regulatory complex protein pan1 [Drosophila subobscura]|uniref:actin cytoskeleton-regulatory complex protein pan1 n=1 Tax=Drosophila subobscura TaxID=7241 RepID=UPI00155AABFB|nr:actin cytoskeleton-regulatory complex protein pan1 [Drosophila subobscura]